MGENDGSAERDREPTEPHKWTYPGDLPHLDHVDDRDEADDAAADDPDSKWAILCSLPAAEADALVARLEGHGLPCDIEEESGDVATVAIRVRSEDLTGAREILARGVEGDLAESEAELRELKESIEARAVENWICPRCNRRTLEVPPLSPGWRKVRLGCLGILFVPLCLLILNWTIDLETLLKDEVGIIPGPWFSIWLIVVLILGATVMVAPRGKQCTECGWDSSSKGKDKTEA